MRYSTRTRRLVASGKLPRSEPISLSAKTDVGLGDLLSVHDGHHIVLGRGLKPGSDNGNAARERGGHKAQSHF